jgi:hypothetical protein
MMKLCIPIKLQKKLNLLLQNLIGMHSGGNDSNSSSLKKNSKKAKFRTASSASASVLAQPHSEMETDPDLIPKHGELGLNSKL